jgi:hypothetical protein
MQQHDSGQKKLYYSGYKRPMAMPIKVFLRFVMCLLKIASRKTPKHDIIYYKVI